MSDKERVVKAMEDLSIPRGEVDGMKTSEVHGTIEPAETAGGQCAAHVEPSHHNSYWVTARGR